MHWDGTITFGSTLQILTMIGLAWAGAQWLKSRMEIFENTLRDHAKSMADHADQLTRHQEATSMRFDKHEERILDLVGHVQRLAGRIEARDRV